MAAPAPGSRAAELIGYRQVGPKGMVTELER